MAMHRSLLSVVALVLVAAGVSFAQNIEATTVDGRKVLLKPDGTWQFLQTNKETPSETLVSYQKPASSNASLSLKGDRFVIWYDSSKWVQQTTTDPSRFEFAHKEGDVYGIIIAERIAMPPAKLKEMAIKNAENVSPDVKVIFEERRRINGVDLMCMKMQGTIQGANFIFYGYYYAGNAGTIQVLTLTSSNLYKDYEAQMSDFLNGTVVKE